MGAAKVLLADDDVDLVLLLSHVLRSEGYEVTTAFDGAAAWRSYQAQKPDIVVLDQFMPEVQGLEVCRRIRAASALTPILMLTADVREDSMLTAMDAGADDYVTKPFRPRQLLARIRGLLRRAAFSPVQGGSDGLSKTIVVGPLSLDLASYRVFVEGREVRLTRTEFKILHILMANADAVVDQASIVRHVWGIAPDDTGAMLRVHIRRLRQKIERDPGRPHFIVTHKGLGYRFRRT